MFSIFKDYEQALLKYNQSHQIYLNIYGEVKNNKDFVNSFKKLGECFQELTEYSKALEYYQKSFEICNIIYKDCDNHADIATSLTSIGLVHQSLSEQGKALEYFEKSLEILKRVHEDDPDNLLIASALENVGNSYAALGGNEKALKSYREAFLICRSTLPPEHPRLAHLQRNMGNCLLKKGAYGKALQCFTNSLNIEKDSEKSKATLTSIGLCYESMGEYLKALEFYFQDLEIESKRTLHDSPTIALLCNNIGSCFNSLGQYDKALEYYHKSNNIYNQILMEESGNGNCKAVHTKREANVSSSTSVFFNNLLGHLNSFCFRFLLFKK